MASLNQAQGGGAHRLVFLDGMRGLAALWVVAFHIAAGNHLPSLKQALPPAVYEWLFVNGHLGIIVFFVLSGYVMSANVSGVNLSTLGAGAFLARRFLRLTPPYYFAIAFALMVAVARHLWGNAPMPEVGVGSLLAHAFYLQELLGRAQIDPVFWTLCIEIQFYLAFVGLSYLGARLAASSFGMRARMWVVNTAAAAGLGCLWLDRAGGLHHGLFLKYWYVFMAGLLLEISARKDWPRSRLVTLLWFGLGLVVLAVGAQRLEVWVTLATMLFIMAVRHEDRLGVWLRSGVLQGLGLISYSLYLIHNPLSMLAIPSVKLINPWAGSAGDLALLAGTVLLLLVGSMAMYRWLERPAITLSRRVRVPAAPA